MATMDSEETDGYVPTFTKRDMTIRDDDDVDGGSDFSDCAFSFCSHAHVLLAVGRERRRDSRDVPAATHSVARGGASALVVVHGHVPALAGPPSLQTSRPPHTATCKGLA